MKAIFYPLPIPILLWAGSFIALGQTPTPTPDPRLLDIAPSGLIDADDLYVLADHWHEEETAFGTIPGDFDESGKPDAKDLLTLLASWGMITSPSITLSLPNLPAGARPMRLLRIPAGTFLMGSPDTERGRYEDWEGPVHTVTITQDFYMGETEVTQAQWKALMGSNPATDLGYTQYGVGNDYPVYNVAWDDIAQVYGFLSRLDSESAYNGFRLPTEAEWEYACRAGDQTRFSFGDNLACDDECGACALASQYMVWCGNDPGRSEPVGPPRLPNAFGLYDMHGNVWEWCQDWFQRDFYSQPGATHPDPRCTDSTSNSRVVRGGDWNNDARFCRSAVRNGYYPGFRFYHIGVRVVLPAAP